MVKVFKFGAVFICLSIATDTMAQESDRFALSGFARVIGGVLDTSDASFEGYDNSIRFSEKSLFALQGDYRLTDTWSASAQLLLHSDSNRDSGIEWAYLTYKPTDNLKLLVGKLRTPYLKYSDVIDVGFAYPWLSAPQQLYGSYLFFSNFEGAIARYQLSIDEVYIDVEGYYGGFNTDFENSGETFNLSVDALYGGVVEVNYGGWQLRAATLSTEEVDADVEGIHQLVAGLNQAGFSDIADFFALDGSADTFIMGVSYDSLDWFFSAERMKVTSDIAVLAGIDNYYATIGTYHNDFQFLVTFAHSKQTLNLLENAIPIGINPQLDALSFGVDELYRSLPSDDLDSVTFTTRWNYSTDIAFKAEVTLLDGKSGKSSYFEIENSAFNRKATLYQVGMEWVF